MRPYPAVTVAAHVVVRRDGRVLAVERCGTGHADGLWALPAGHVERGESAAEAARRELIEETGLRVDSEQLQFVLLLDRITEAEPRLDVVFETSRWTGEPENLEPSRASAVAWLTVDELLASCPWYVEAMLRGQGAGYRVGATTRMA